MATLVKNNFLSSKKKSFIPSPRVLTPLGVKAIVEAVSEDSAPCAALQKAFARYKQFQNAPK